MNTSPYDVQVTVADFYIKTGYQILPGNIYQEPNPANSILAAYNTLIISGDLFHGIEKMVSAEVTDMAYLKELITVTTSEDVSLLSLKVKGAEMAENEKILREKYWPIFRAEPWTYVDGCRLYAWAY